MAKVRGKCLISARFIQTKYAAMPIKMYRLVHTGANNQSGGLKDGLFRYVYQVLTDFAVARPAIAPMDRVKAILMINATGLNFIIV